MNTKRLKLTIFALLGGLSLTNKLEAGSSTIINRTGEEVKLLFFDRLGRRPKNGEACHQVILADNQSYELKWDCFLCGCRIPSTVRIYTTIYIKSSRHSREGYRQKVLGGSFNPWDGKTYSLWGSLAGPKRVDVHEGTARNNPWPHKGEGD